MVDVESSLSIAINKIHSTCRHQNKGDSKIEICLGRGRKHCEIRRKCWLPAFSTSPTMFSKGHFFKVLNASDYLLRRYGADFHNKKFYVPILHVLIFLYQDQAAKVKQSNFFF